MTYQRTVTRLCEKVEKEGVAALARITRADAGMTKGSQLAAALSHSRNRRPPNSPTLTTNGSQRSIYLLRATCKTGGFDLMSAHDANAPAHPTDPTMLDKGLTKREYIAAIALMATDSSATAQERAKQAVELTDALFKALHG